MTDITPTPDPDLDNEPGRFKTWLSSVFTLGAADVLVYRIADDLGGWLILPMVVFSPWAFGSVQPWAIHVMTLAGLALGFLFLIKLFIRHAKGYPAPRWDLYSPRTGTLSRRPHRPTRLVTQALAWLTVAVLAECVISAWNVAANYNSETQVFEYHHYLAWLPHSLDGGRTWSYFRMYLGLAGTFWAVWDWLAGMTATEERMVLGGSRNAPGRTSQFPARLRLLLSVLCLNGALIGLEGIVQRVSGTDKVLFVKKAVFQNSGEGEFGPFAYRSNAAQYFNMLWPVCLGFWLALQHAADARSHRHLWLLACAAIMAACPIISSSKAGALVCVGMMMITFVYLGLSSFRPPPPTETVLASRKGRTPLSEKPAFEQGATTQSRIAASPATSSKIESRTPASPSPSRRARGAGNSTTGWLLLFMVVSLGLGWYFGWDLLFPRLEQISESYAGRESMYAAALPMARDYPWFGTGPGTFGTVFQLYRYSDEVYWAEQLHNDWLETRITFGLLGLGMILAALATVGIRWFMPGGMRGQRRLVVLSWLSVAGSLLTAKYDFPFQLHSTLLLFLIICAVLFNFSKTSSSSQR